MLAHIPSGGAYGEDHDDGGGHGDDQGARAWKRRKRKIKWVQGKGEFDRAILFW